MQKTGNIFIFMLATLALLAACSPQKKEEKRADAVLLTIEQMIACENYDSAKTAIAGFHTEFRWLIAKRKTAVALNDTIVRRESTAILACCDSLLLQKTLSLNEMLKNFIFEKNADYQELGAFIHKTQKTEANALRNYLKFYVDENATLYMTGNYTGNKIRHSKIRITAGDIYVETDTAGYFHTYNDGERDFENLTFTGKTAMAFAVFINNNASKNINVKLTGNKTATYTLTAADKKAIAETYAFWTAKAEIQKLQKEKQQAEMRLEKIKALYY